MGADGTGLLGRKDVGWLVGPGKQLCGVAPHRGWPLCAAGAGGLVPLGHTGGPDTPGFLVHHHLLRWAHLCVLETFKRRATSDLFRRATSDLFVSFGLARSWKLALYVWLALGGRGRRGCVETNWSCLCKQSSRDRKGMEQTHDTRADYLMRVFWGISKWFANVQQHRCALVSFPVSGLRFRSIRRE